VNQTTNHDDDVWADDGLASAFETPNEAVIDVESGAEHVQAEDAHIASEEHYEEAPAPAAKSKPNLAILGVAGLLFVALLGGVGMVLMEKFGADEVAPAVATGSVIFAEAPATATNPGDLAPPSLPDALAVALADSPAIPVAEKPLDSLAEAERMAAEPVTAAPPAPPAPPAAVAEAVPLAVPATAAGDSRRAEDPAAAKPERKAVRRSSLPGKEPVARTLLAQAQKEESIAINPKLHVVAVYPLSGKHVQAWVSDGRTTNIVRVGDEVSQGVVVTAIKAESLEVLTPSGRVTSRGVLR